MLKQATADGSAELPPPRMLGRAVLRRLYRKVYPGCLFRTFDCVKSGIKMPSGNWHRKKSDSLKGWLSPKVKVLNFSRFNGEQYCEDCTERFIGHTEGVAFSEAESAACPHSPTTFVLVRFVLYKSNGHKGVFSPRYRHDAAAGRGEILIT